MAEDGLRGLELEAEAEKPPAGAEPGFWKKLKRGLFMTHTEILDRVGAAIEDRAIVDEETLEYLEESLIAADIGVETSMELVETVRGDSRRSESGDVLRLRERLVDHMAVLLLDAPRLPVRPPGPLVTLLVGVNGVGKTTAAAKLARWSQRRGEKVMLAAADTFRAAAIEQLTLWSERLEVDIVKQQAEADPAAVVFDALQAARARKVDHLIVDTAGRLHTKHTLMAELEKIRRVIDREGADRTIRTLLVLDATTGQNAVAQAKEFARAVHVDGVVLAKIDGTAKGGVVVAIARELRIPVVFLGVGETADDLVEFRPREFATALLG